MSDDLTFLSREELLRGLPARRASMLLFAIESRTAHLVSNSRQVAARFLTEKAAEVREQAFLEAISEGSDLPMLLAIQDLERYAPEWADLVPSQPNERAAVARLMSQKWHFTSERVPNIRAALGLDTISVQSAYERLYSEPLSSIYATQLDVRERFHWWRANASYRLETLSPFWTAYSLTLTETVGAGILGLPIALAEVGVIAGLILLIVFGIVNILTISAISESIIRNGNIRYGNSYFGGLVNEYLGRVGSVIFTVALLLLILLFLLVFYIGLSTTLGDSTGIPSTVWAALLFLVGFYFLRRETIDATVASALVVGTTNMTLIILLFLVTVPYIRSENLLYMNVPLMNGQPFDSSIMKLVFGVILTAFFGHISTGNAAKVVLRRDPSGRTFMWGNIAAFASAIVLYCLWVIGVNGAIDPKTLASTSGTALTPLATVVGPIVDLLGGIFVVLGMGMSSIHFSLGLFNQVREWLPTPSHEEYQAPTSLAERIQKRLHSPQSQFWISFMPIVLIFLLVEWLLLTNQESFTGVLSFMGMITVALLAGIFPMLMIVASRRKGDYISELRLGFLGHPLLVGGLYLLFWTSIFLHGLIIWSDPLQQGAALFVALLTIGITIAFIQQGLFKARTVIELRQSANGQAFFNMTANGEALPAELTLTYPDEQLQLQAATGEVPRFAALQTLSIWLPATESSELKVWAHQITPQGRSESLPVRLELAVEGNKKEVDLKSAGGQLVLPCQGACRLLLTLGRPDFKSLP